MLASRLLRQSACQLPIRHAISPPSTLLRPRARAFHATAPRKDAVDPLLYLPHELLQLMHTALPWYAAIPAAAFIIRGILVTTATSRVRERTSRYAATNPLRMALALSENHRLKHQNKFDTMKQFHTTLARNVKQKVKGLDTRWNCSHPLLISLSWAVMQIPIFIGNAEVIRRMSGTHEGLLRLAANSIGVTKSAGENGYYAKDVAENPWFDASLANEGALWFPNLLEVDPTGYLAYSVSALMLLNIYISGNGPRTAGEVQSKWSVRGRRIMVTVALLAGPLLQGLPSGMLLYWVSSTSSAILWNAYLDRKYPILTGYGPCKRELVNMDRQPMNKLLKGRL
ncbi:hypothetical protein M011DRAFT_469392 [Sporormia fimetaria CBS 119925]|uniref:Mitochondrial export translocase Oxa2 n=1 Tax=Sporormia fimetaria CBS 119925 TaxID=1340428 RepID=A0A6A6V863_9PLEO|nr:hypothetical protein M011DRAFT_469392 [Sporormia fimetaria CBS 119925]